MPENKIAIVEIVIDSKVVYSESVFVDDPNDLIKDIKHLVLNYYEAV